MAGGSGAEFRTLLAILTVGFGLRLACALAVQRHLDSGSHEVCLIPGDADGYWELARKIAAGEEYALYTPPRRVMRMPGFPVVLALPRLVCGDNLLAARIWLAVLGTAACGFTWRLGRELHSGAVGLWAAAATACSPVLALFSVLILSETAFAAALTACLCLVVRLHRHLQQPATKGESVFALLTGVTFAIATYLRPTWLLLGPVTAVWLLVSGSDWRRRLRVGGLLLVGLYGSLLPWGLRNATVTGHFTLTTFWVGPSLYDGLNPAATGDSDMTFFDRDRLLDSLSEFEMDKEYRRRAWQYAADHPGRALQLMGIKLLRYSALWPNAAQFRAPWQQAVVAVSFSLLLIPALYGTWRERRNRTLLLVTWGPLVYFGLIHMLFVGSIRYRLPAEYPLAVLTGIGLSALLNLCRSRSATGPCPPGVSTESPGPLSE